MDAQQPLNARPVCAMPLEFLNAKVRGRRGALYEGTRLEQLARERTIGDLSRRLYPNEEIPGPVALERRLLEGCVGELSLLAFYLDEPYHTFYLALLDRYPVGNLKVLLRLFTQEAEPPAPGAHEAAEPRERAKDLLLSLPRGPALPVEKLLGSANVREFVGRIPLPAVRESAKRALPLYEDSRKAAYLEMALDQGYWQQVWETLRRLPSGEAHECLPPLQCEFDTMRLLGTMRAGGTYGLAWEQWKSALIAGPSCTTTTALQDVHARPELENVTARFPWVKAAVERYRRAEETPDLGRLEEALWYETIRLADRQYYTNATGPAVLVSFFYLKREELRRLLGLTQTLRYGRAEGEVAAYLE